jgi:hypothetical protein
MAGDNILSLRLVNNGYTDFYPYELEFEEGFSKLYKGRLMVLSHKARAHEELVKDLLDQRVTVSVAQRLADGVTYRKRYIHGIISGVESRGVYSTGSLNGERTDCYRYVLTLESELSRLRYTRVNSKPYYRKNPVDIIAEITGKHGIEALLPENALSRDYSGKLMFDQSDISDWEFLLGILYMYGITFSYRHGRVNGEGLGRAELIFSDGYVLPVSDVDYSDRRGALKAERFDFLKSDEANDIWKMDSWSMRDGIGVDGIRLIGNREWEAGKTGEGSRYLSYSRMFHGYDNGAGSGEVDKDVKKILSARYRTFELEKRTWKAGAGNLLLTPGRLLELSSYNGKDDRALITARVNGARLKIRTAWPRTMALPPEHEGEEEFLELEGLCMDYGKNVPDKRLCLNPVKI